MKNYSYILLLLPFIAITACSTSKSTSKTSLSPQEFKAGLDKDKNAVLLDVRTPEEFNKEHIGTDPVNLNWNDEAFKSEISKYSKSKPLYVYCLSGGRSGAAAKYLRSEGYKVVYELQGGILNWKSSGLPVISGGQVKTESSQPSSNMSLENYKHIVADPEQLVLVDFNAPWCGPCKMMKPFLKELENDYQGKVKLVMINVDENSDLAESLKVKGLPTLKLYKQNKLVWDQLGYASKEVITAELKKNL